VWSVSRPGRFTLGEMAVFTDRIGRRVIPMVGTRFGLDKYILPLHFRCFLVRPLFVLQTEISQLCI
jgi:hypothetical protein